MVPSPTESDRHSHDFEQRVLVYIDTVGWKEAVEKAVLNSAWRAKLYDFHGMSAFSRCNQELEGRIQHEQFSDSYVLSQRVDSGPDTCVHVARHASAHWTSTLYQLGLLSSGAIVRGELIHTPSKSQAVGPPTPGMLFGPAMNLAVELTQDSGLKPRIVLDDLVRADLLEHAPMFVAVDPEDKEPFLNAFGVVHAYGNIAGMLSRVREVTLAGWEELRKKDLATTRSARRKWAWLAWYYNGTLTQHSEACSNIEPIVLDWPAGSDSE